jgi:hypothetical protein
VWVEAAPLTNARLELGGHLVRDVVRLVRAVGECLEAALFVVRHPSIDALARDAVLLGDLGDGEAVADHCDDRVVTLFHLADLLEHLATSLAKTSREQVGPKCQPSAVTAERIRRSNTLTLVRPEGLEPSTCGLRVRCSAKLS